MFLEVVADREGLNTYRYKTHYYSDIKTLRNLSDTKTDTIWNHPMSPLNRKSLTILIL